MTRQLIRECFRLLAPWERAIFYFAAIVAICSGLVLAIIFTATHTTRVADFGGSYTEIILGSPRFINPVLAPANDADRDLVKLLYSGLMRYDDKGNLVPDLAESYSVATDAKMFIFKLRQDALWHDGEPVGVDDVLFTIRLLQSYDYQSPLRFAWQGVRAEKLDDTTIAMTLQGPYEPFLAQTVVGIMPRHIWQDVQPQAFALSDYNLYPVGSGPFAFANLERRGDGTVTSLHLKRNNIFYRQKPWLEKITITFSESREEALAMVSKNQVDGFAGDFTTEMTQMMPSAHRQTIAMRFPRVFGVFFNQIQSPALAQKAVREALHYAIDRQTLANELYGEDAEVLYGPLPSSVFAFTDEITKRQYDPQKAAALLENAGWKIGGDGMRVFTEKKKEEQTVGSKKITVETVVTTTLEFSLLTANVPELEKVAERLKTQWEQIGARVTVEVAGVADIQGERIRPRLFDAVLFGQVYGLDPDPYAFWHSSQRRDPGLNLAQYHNPKVDRALEDARQLTDPETRKRLLADFQKIVADDMPALFLFSPHYQYHLSGSIHNVQTSVIANPSERFGNITSWYMKTKRVWK
ncbi:MAG: peptide ABC transporter substrate-binding protein [bacterium]|nr:peptide ABC transporter substrate-binding protein [bacterium]